MAHPFIEKFSILPSRRLLLTILAGLLVFAVRAHWIAESSYRLPYWDEIPAELLPNASLAPGTMPTIGELTAPHNEHRILWQRLVALGLFRGNHGMWDSQLRCLANAVFTALYAVLLAVVVRGSHRGRRGHALFWPGILALAGPVAYQNMLFAFQTSFHLQMLFSIAALAGLTGAHWKQARWWLGLAAGLAALFTNGSGFFTAPVVLVWTAISLMRPREGETWFHKPNKSDFLAALPAITAALLILVPGLLLLHRPEGTSHMGAANVGEFFHGLAKHFAWPWQETIWLAPVVWSPILMLGWLVVRGRGDDRWLASARPVLCIAGWLVLNFLAMAWARGAHAVGPVPRYEDFHLVGILMNACALMLCLFHWRDRGHGKKLPSVWIAAWLLPTAGGLIWLFHFAIRIELPDFRAFGNIQENNIARYTIGGDSSVFENYVSRFHLPYPNPAELKAWLDQPEVRAALPSNFHADGTPFKDARCEGACSPPALPAGLELPPGETWWASSFQSNGPQEGSFLSAPILARENALRLWYLGMDTGGALKLRLKPEGKGKAINIRTERRHGTSTWMPITIPVEAGKSYRLEFADRSKNGWGAFTLPVDEPPLSRLSSIVCAWAAPAAVAIGILILLALGLGETRRSTNQSPAAEP
jgi:hypothetical protein